MNTAASAFRICRQKSLLTTPNPDIIAMCQNDCNKICPNCKKNIRMEISRPLKRIIIIELLVPVSLLTLGIYHGLMQTIYRAGVLQQAAFAKLDYYQGLTLHGVINAVVLTTFFAVAFGHATITYYFKKE